VVGVVLLKPLEVIGLNLIVQKISKTSSRSGAMIPSAEAEILALAKKYFKLFNYF